MSRRSYAQDQRRRRRACRLDVERCEERTLLSSGLGGLTAFGPPDTIPLKAAADYTLTTLASFNGTNGAFPERGLVLDAHGNLFGTVPFGGANGQGAVYELAAGSRTITTLASFNGTNGDRPESDLVLDAHGNLFGTTQFGGANGQGTVFKLAAGSNTITTLASFHGTNGDQPTGSLVRDAHGNLFGATAFGGANGQGTVFKLAAGSNTITTLASFNGTNGDRPTGGLVRDAHGNLFGATAFGGANGQGTVYELAAGSRTITTLASFNGANGAGAFPAPAWCAMRMVTSSARRQPAGPTAKARCSNWPPAVARSPRSHPSTAPTGPFRRLAWRSSTHRATSSARPKTAESTTWARCTSWPPAAIRLPPWPRSTEPTGLIQGPAWSSTHRVTSSARRMSAGLAAGAMAWARSSSYRPAGGRTTINRGDANSQPKQSSEDLI